MSNHFFETHLKFSSPIFVSSNTKNKYNKCSTHSSAKDHLTCLPYLLTAQYWMCSAIPRNYLNCLTATVPQFLVSLLWRAFSEQKLKLLTMHLLKKKRDIFFWKLFVPSQKAGVLVKGWSSVWKQEILAPPPPQPFNSPHPPIEKNSNSQDEW